MEGFELGRFVMMGAMIAIGLVVTFAAFYWVKASHQKKLGPLAMAFAGQMHISVFGGYYVTFMNQSFEAKIKLIPSGKNTPTYLVLEQQGTLGFNLKLSNENFATRAAEQIGLLQDLKTGDVAFDDQYRISSSDAGQAMTALADPLRKEAIAHFTRHGFSELNYQNQILTITKARYSNDDLNPELIRRHFDMMLAIVAQA